MLVIMVRIRQLTDQQMLEYIVYGEPQSNVPSYPNIEELYNKLNQLLAEKDSAYHTTKRKREERSCLHVRPQRKRMQVDAPVQGMCS